jgi:hypothetical protein
MNTRIIAIAFATALACTPVLASPIYRVDSQVAQGNSGSGVTVVLAPGHPVSINFSKLGEKIASVTPGDRSRFVFNVAGSVLILKAIKQLHFQGEYSTGGDTSIIVTTQGPSGQMVYPIAVKFGSRPVYRVVEVSPDGGSSAPIPAVNRDRNRIPLTTSQATPPYRPSVPAQVAILPLDEPIPVPEPPAKSEVKGESPAPVGDEFSPEAKAAIEPTPTPEPTPQPSPQATPKPKSISKIKAKPKPEAVAVQPKKESVDEPSQNNEPTPQPNLSPSQRALAEMQVYKKPEPAAKKTE